MPVVLGQGTPDYSNSLWLPWYAILFLAVHPLASGLTCATLIVVAPVAPGPHYFSIWLLSSLDSHRCLIFMKTQREVSALFERDLRYRRLDSFDLLDLPIAIRFV